MFVFAQFVGIIGLVFTVMSFFQEKRDKILLCQLLANISYSLQLFLLHAYGGTFLCMLSVIRTLFFYRIKTPGAIQLFIFSAIAILTGFFDYFNIISFIPIIGFLAMTYSLWQKDIIMFKRLALINAFCWLIYDFLVGAYTASFSAIIEIISVILALSAFKKEVIKNEKKA